MEVPIGVSNRHIHLTQEDLTTLCGDITLEKKNDLTQPGQFASTMQLTIKTEKDTISNVRVLGPTRTYTQVEISKTDAYKLGINPPVRESGDVQGSAVVTIVGPQGEVTKECAIIASRHIHISHEKRAELGLLETEKVSVSLPGEKSGIINNVTIKETNPAYFELHLDTDDANAHLIKNKDIANIIL